MDSWDHYRTLLAVLAEGSLSGAARTLGLTQPTVGRHIEALEADLGASLFTRSGKIHCSLNRRRARRRYAESITYQMSPDSAPLNRHRSYRRAVCSGTWRRQRMSKRARHSRKSSG